MLSSENNKHHEHDDKHEHEHDHKHEHDDNYNQHSDEKELFSPEDLNDFFGQPLAYKKRLLFLKQLLEEEATEREAGSNVLSEDGSLQQSGHRKHPSYVLGLTVTGSFILSPSEEEEEKSEAENYFGEEEE